MPDLGDPEIAQHKTPVSEHKDVLGFEVQDRPGHAADETAQRPQQGDVPVEVDLEGDDVVGGEQQAASDQDRRQGAFVVSLLHFFLELCAWLGQEHFTIEFGFFQAYSY